MKKKWFLFILAIITVGTIFTRNVFHVSMRPSYPVSCVKVQNKSIVRQLECTGVVEAGNLIQLVSAFPAKVDKIYVSEGEAVKKGQLLLEFDKQEIAYELKKAKLEYEARKEIVENEQRLLSEQRIQTASVMAQSMGFDYDKYNQSLGEYQTQMTENKSVPQNADIASKQLELLSLQIEIFEAKLNQYKIYSPVDGKVSLIPIKNGHLITEGIPLMNIQENGLPIVRARISMNDLSTLKVNQSVVISASTGLFKGALTHIRPMAVEAGNMSNGQQSVGEVEITFKNAPNVLLGTVVDVYFLLQKTPVFAVVPLESVIEQDDKHYVYVIEKGLSVKKQVEVGVRDEFYIQLLSGVKVGDNIIYEASQVWEGRRVKAID